MHNSELHKFAAHPKTPALLYYVTNRKRGGELCQYVISGNWVAIYPYSGPRHCVSNAVKWRF